MQKISAWEDTMGAIKHLGHIVLYAKEPKALADWYCEMLGMEVVTVHQQWNGHFLSFGTRDHDVAIFPAPEDRADGTTSFNHVGLEFAGDLEAYKAFHQKLLDHQVTITATVDHETAYGIYFLDPEGHCLEVFFQRITEGALETMRRIGAFGNPIDVQAL